MPIGNYNINFGKYKGLTYDELIAKDIKYVMWICKNKIHKNEDVDKYLCDKLPTEFIKEYRPELL